jgi:hypothetical protein
MVEDTTIDLTSLIITSADSSEAESDNPFRAEKKKEDELTVALKSRSAAEV